MSEKKIMPSKIQAFLIQLTNERLSHKGTCQENLDFTHTHTYIFVSSQIYVKLFCLNL